MKLKDIIILILILLGFAAGIWMLIIAINQYKDGGNEFIPLTITLLTYFIFLLQALANNILIIKKLIYTVIRRHKMFQLFISLEIETQKDKNVLSSKIKDIEGFIITKQFLNSQIKTLKIENPNGFEYIVTIEYITNKLIIKFNPISSHIKYIKKYMNDTKDIFDQLEKFYKVQPTKYCARIQFNDENPYLSDYVNMNFVDIKNVEYLKIQTENMIMFKNYIDFTEKTSNKLMSKIINTVLSIKN